MGFTMHHKPLIGLALQRADLVPDFIVEDFAAAARHRIETGGLEPHENVQNRHFGHAGNIQDFRWRKAVEVDSESLFYSAQKLLVVIDFQIGMNATLHENSGST